MSLGKKGGILMDSKNDNQDDCQSRNEFVVKAENFYADFLAGR